MAGGLAAGLASVAASSSSRGAPVDDIAWGVNGHPITAYPGIAWSDQLDLVRSLGFTQYRVNLGGDGSSDALEELMGLAQPRGITLLPILQVFEDMDETSPGNLRQQAYDLALSMSRRFKGRMPVWELANELENYAIIQPCEIRFDGTKYPCDWGPGGGVGVLDYHPGRWEKVSAVIMGLSMGVKDGDPNARRAVGTAGWGHLGAHQRLQADGVPWDITVWHDYPGVTEPYLAILAAYGKPIWITEFNANIGKGMASDLEKHARELGERIAFYRRVRARYRIEAAHVYELLDETYWGDTGEARMGLVRIEGSGQQWRIGKPKPAAAVVRQALMRA